MPHIDRPARSGLSTQPRQGEGDDRIQASGTLTAADDQDPDRTGTACEAGRRRGNRDDVLPDRVADDPCVHVAAETIGKSLENHTRQAR